MIGHSSGQSHDCASSVVFFCYSTAPKVRWWKKLSTRLGRALGMDSVESAISSNAIVLTTIKDGECLTSTRKNVDRGINMHVVTEVQHIVILAEP